jgi:hypothetical protein
MAEKLKTATIVPSTKKAVIGGKELTVPNTVEVAKLADLPKELILSGPSKKKNGTQRLITIDGQKMSFDKDGNLL